jgi:hypothetical protein
MQHVEGQTKINVTCIACAQHEHFVPTAQNKIELWINYLLAKVPGQLAWQLLISYTCLKSARDYKVSSGSKNT